MQLEGREESTNVEDRRGFNEKSALAVGGGGGGLLLLILAFLFGGGRPDGPQDRPPGGQGVREADSYKPADPEEEKMVHFSKVILRDTEKVWEEQFRLLGKQYRAPKMVLFKGGTRSGCGFAESVVGPFYCPADSKVYLDVSFFRDMERKLNAKGEFARAYVIAHEVGHHVQHLVGYSQRVHEARGTSQENQMSVRLELQADYLAGVWAHHAQEKFKYLEPGDIDSAINAAFQIGDDRLQKKARGYVVPEKFTHGSSKQRMRWFQEGYKTGNVKAASQLFELPYGNL